MDPAATLAEVARVLRPGGVAAGFVKEVLLHSEEGGGAARYVRHALNYSVEDLAALRDRGVSDEALGLAALRRAADRFLGAGGRWVLSWRVRLGVRA
jgi:hypothetical protein